jgi:hypothetical protein
MVVGNGPTSNPTRRDPENKSEEIHAASTVKNATEGKPLVILQVNCRSICNKVLEFWNLIDRIIESNYPDVVIGTESWLNEEINNAEVFRGGLHKLQEG